MAKRSVRNPITTYKARESITYEVLAERLGISIDYARKLGSDGVQTVAPQMAMQFEERTEGAISYRAVMRWVYDRAKNPEAGSASPGSGHAA